MGALLDELRRAGDPSADAVIGDLARTQQIRAVSRILRHLVDNDQPVPSELPRSIARWLDETPTLPDWVDQERFERGCAMVVEHGPQVCVVLATASLVYCYAGYPGVKVLRFSRRWDVAVDGLPICQGDLAGTLMSFSSMVVDSLRRLGVRIEDEEAEDYYYRRRVIGEMLGIDPAAIPPDLAAAHELTDLIARRNHRRSAEGIEMTGALFDLHANSLPPGFRGATPALTRYLVGDEMCDVVDLPRTRWDRKLCWQAGVGRALDRAQSARGPIGSLTKLVGGGMLNQRVAEMAGGRSASFSIPIPLELERSGTASGVFPAIDDDLVRIAQAQPA
jgi:ER-bound oxygenase mpaB/B'/Rubber oxygenase, catalytic domain